MGDGICGVDWSHNITVYTGTPLKRIVHWLRLYDRGSKYKISIVRSDIEMGLLPDDPMMI